MCGIVAMMGRGVPVDAAALERAVHQLRHRGPDARRIWIAGDALAGLGHARLSIMDLETGDQPIANENDTLRIVANGEFYDHERIAGDLVRRGHLMRTRSDSEVALHLYEERGAACLGALRGEFAFVIWDARNETLFAARDRFGIKPLFYTEAGGVLMLASEAKAFAAAGVSLRWDHESMFDHLFGCAATDRSLFESVKQVPPGHFLVATRTGVRIERYWDLDYPRAPHGSLSTAQELVWIERLRAGVEEAVKLRLRADVPVGCLLSGGLDSSAALGIARKHTPGRLAAFTVAFDHADFDESAVARETAAAAGAEFHEVRLSDTDFAAHFSDAVWHAESLHYNAHGAARFLLSRAVRDAGYKVVLAGEGADELGAGYHFCARALTAKKQGGVVRWASALARLVGRRSDEERLIADVSPWLVRAGRVLGFPADMQRYLAAKIGAMHGLLAPEFAKRMRSHDPFHALYRRADAPGQLRGREPVKQLLALWMKSAFPTYVLAGERLDMAHGVELRLPYLDHELFAVAREIPASLFLRDGHQKWVLREAMRPFVPEGVRLGKKRPFLAPPSALREGGALYALVQDTLRGSAMEKLPFFERAAVVRMLDGLCTLPVAARAAFDPVLLMLVSACVLQDRYRL